MAFAASLEVGIGQSPLVQQNLQHNSESQRVWNKRWIESSVHVCVVVFLIWLIIYLTDHEAARLADRESFTLTFSGSPLYADCDGIVHLQSLFLWFRYRVVGNRNVLVIVLQFTHPSHYWNVI